MNTRLRTTAVWLCSVASVVSVACGTSTVPADPTELSASECSDGRDNDADGASDCADLACTVHAFCARPPAENTAALCANEADDDDDGLVDCDDPGCAAEDSCAPVLPVESTAALCANGDDDDVDGTIDCADRDCDAFCGGPGATHTYVISALSMPEVSGSGTAARAAGFDLDGVRSTGDGTTCVDVTPDYASLNDPGELGVDNAVAALVPTIESLTEEPIDSILQTAIREGRLLLLLQVRGVDSLVTDEAVEVQLYSGAVPGGGAPMLVGSSLSPDQTFSGTPIGDAVVGAIVAGRLRARIPTLPLDTGVLLFGAVLRDVELRTNITERALTNGAIGGSMRLDEIAAAAEAMEPGQGATVYSVLGSVSDLEPQAADPTFCDSMSAGYLFTGVRAELDDP